jgi:hypothetical protein
MRSVPAKRDPEIRPEFAPRGFSTDLRRNLPVNVFCKEFDAYCQSFTDRHSRLVDLATQPFIDIDLRKYTFQVVLISFSLFECCPNGRPPSRLQLRSRSGCATFSTVYSHLIGFESICLVKSIYYFFQLTSAACRSHIWGCVGFLRYEFLFPTKMEAKILQGQHILHL